MKFAKALLLASLLAPTVASAQAANGVTPIIPTNFAFLIPAVSFLVVPFALGGNNDDVVPILLPAPTPTPTPSTR